MVSYHGHMRVSVGLDSRTTYLARHAALQVLACTLLLVAGLAQATYAQSNAGVDGRTLAESCGIDVETLAHPPPEEELEGHRIVAPTWPPPDTIPGGPSPRVDPSLAVLASAEVAGPDGTPNGWLALMVDAREVDAASYTEWLLDEHEGRRFVLFWIPASELAAPLELWSQRFDFDLELWPVYDSLEEQLRETRRGAERQIQAATGLRLERHLFEVCVPSRCRDDFDPEGVDPDANACTTSCFTALDFLAPTGRYGPAYETSEEALRGTAAGENRERMLTLRDVDDDGEEEVIRLFWRPSDIQTRRRRPIRVTLSYRLVERELQLEPLPMQPMWAHIVRGLEHPTSDPDRRVDQLVQARAFLSVLEEADFEQDSLGAQLECARDYVRDALFDGLIARDGVVETWRRLTQLEEPVDFDRVFSASHGPDLHPARWELPVEQLPPTGWVGWDGSHLQISTTSGETYVCDDEGWSCSLGPPVEPPPIQANPTQTMSLLYLRGSRFFAFVFAPPALLAGLDRYPRTLPCIWARGADAYGLSLTEREVTYVRLRNDEIGTDGHGGPQGDCVWTGDTYSGLGFVGWISDREFVYAATDQFISVSLDGEQSALTWSDIPDTLIPWAGLTGDRRFRYFVTMDRTGALWRVERDSRRVEYLADLGGEHLHSPGTYVVPTRDGGRIAVVLNHRIHGVFEVRAQPGADIPLEE